MIILFRLVRKRIVSSLLAIIVTKFRRLYLLQLHFIVIFFYFFHGIILIPIVKQTRLN